MTLRLERLQRLRTSHGPRNLDGHSVRPEIQALRALAVVLVVIYHMDPRLLPGGFIGVDVFFVISGFLITAHIAKGLERSGGGFKLSDFYLRRVRRLLPAALTVLAVVGVVTLIRLPTTTWNETGPPVIASALYVQNWYLAARSDDYLAQATYSPVEHFWSLSVEEQFYLFWPVLLIFAAWLGLRLGRRHLMLVSGIATITAVSFAVSVWQTYAAPNVAYFATQTRVWELGLGGLLALTIPQLAIDRRLRIALSWTALLIIVACAFTFDADTMFPGYVAAIPVVAAAAMISAGDVPGRLSTSWLINRRTTQFLGDISYSIYLWHWPIIVLAPMVILGANYWLAPEARLAPVIACIPVAWLSKRYIEDRFRVAGSSSRMASAMTSRRVVITTTTLLAIVAVVVGAVLYHVSETRISRAHTELSAFERGPQDCVGAAALTSECAGRSPTGVHPDPIIAAGEQGASDCFQTYTRSEVIKCEYGPDQGATRNIALVGDSHAFEWRAAIEELAKKRNWHVSFYGMAGCPFAEGIGTQYCRRHTEALTSILIDRPVDLVITSAASGFGYGSHSGYGESVAGFVKTWRTLMTHGMRVIAIADLPLPVKAGINDPVGAVEAGQNPTFSRSAGLGEPDAIVGAAHESGAALIDMSDQFCVNELCPPVIGGVLVYSDHNHITDTYARSVVPALGRRIDQAAAGGAP
jgi:peptidoglycan/LPS O-acetylase OafA/YrhL